MAREYTQHRPPYYEYLYPGKSMKHRWADPQLDALLSNGSVMARIMRTITHHKNGTHSKHPDDFTGLDGSTLAVNHIARSNVWDFFPFLISQNEIRAHQVWNHDQIAKLKDKSWLEANDPWVDDGGLARFPWIVQGYQAIAREPWAMRAQIDFFVREYLPDGVRIWRRAGWKTARGLAIAVRARNSGLGRVIDYGKEKFPYDEKKAVEAALDAYKSTPDDKKLHSRSKLIKRLFPEDEMIDETAMPKAEDLAWDEYQKAYESGGWSGRVLDVPANAPRRASTVGKYLVGGAAVLGAGYLWRKRSLREKKIWEGIK